jgi:hypothetical protein
MQSDDNQKEVIWYDEPSVLLDDRRFFPTGDMTKVEKLNALMKYSLVLFVVLALFRQSTDTVYIPVLVAVMTWFLNEYGAKSEGLDPSGEFVRLPRNDNPFMNTLLTEVGKKDLPQAAPHAHPKIKKDVEYLFNKNVYKDAEDIYNKNNSQRQFFTMPNTNEFGVKNGDSVKFANWLYNKPAPTCKEDTRYCADHRSLLSGWENMRRHRQAAPPTYPICGRHCHYQP